MKDCTVVCLWIWDAEEKTWRLEEVLPYDGDGHCLASSSVLSGCESVRHSWTLWIRPDGSDNFLMGRAVTGWTAGNGVRLFDFSPLEWSDWMAATFVNSLTRADTWKTAVADAHVLYNGTIAAAREKT